MLADKYGVSAERIRQIEVKAMKQMRKVIENCGSRVLEKGQALPGLFLSLSLAANARHLIYIKVSLLVTQ